MSKDVDNRTTSKILLNPSNSSSESTSNTEKKSSNSKESLRCPFVSYSKKSLKSEDEPVRSTSSSSTKTRDFHYITKVQPKSASCSFSPLDSDRTVVPEENSEYARILQKELSAHMFRPEVNEKKSSSNSSTTNSCSFEVIPLTDIPAVEIKNTDTIELKKDTSKEVIKETNQGATKTINKIFAGPRLTTSDSFISLNRKYFQDGCRKCVLPTEAEVKTWEKPTTIPNKSNVESEQTSSLTPVSLFENEKYKTFTDSNSHEDDVIDSIKVGSGKKKGVGGKVEYKKGIELKNSSLLSIPSTVCRICHTNTVNERLLSPCYCKGSLAYVHLSCLERWLNQSSRSYCELCLYQYNAVETLRYGFFEGIRLWVRHPRNRNHVRSDCLIAFLLTLVTLGLVVICFIGMDYFMIEGIKLGLSKMWTKSFIVSFLGVIMMGYVVTMYLIVKDQFVPWYTWWKNTLNIRLLLSPTVTQTQRI